METNIDLTVSCIANKLYNSGTSSYGILGDNGGKILFFYYYYLYTKNTKWQMAFEKEVDIAFKYLSKNIVPLSYCDGITGYFYLFHFLKKQFAYLDLDITEVESVYEQYLKNKMFDDINNGYYDFLYSSIGIAFYFLGKRDMETIDNFVDCLLQIAKKTSDAIYWIDKFENPVNTTSNIGLAHGMSSIVIFLSKVYLINRSSKVRSILINSLNYFYMQKLPTPTVNLYPSMSLQDDDLRSRLGWCYGDLCIGLAFWHAWKATSENLYKLEALKIFNHSAHRINLEENFVFDAGICHGTSGISHIFRRIYWETLDDTLKKASDFWTEKTIEFGQCNNETIHYKSWTMDGFLSCDNSFIEGLSGIALALLSSIAPKDFSNWDELLLIH